MTHIHEGPLSELAKYEARAIPGRQCEVHRLKAPCEACERYLQPDTFSNDEIIDGIVRAIHDREFEVVPGLLAMLAIRDPASARQVWDALHGKLTIDLGVKP